MWHCELRDTVDPITRYEHLINVGILRADPHQRTIIERLQRLHQDLVGYDPGEVPPQTEELTPSFVSSPSFSLPLTLTPDKSFFSITDNLPNIVRQILLPGTLHTHPHSIHRYNTQRSLSLRQRRHRQDDVDGSFSLDITTSVLGKGGQIRFDKDTFSFVHAGCPFQAT